METYKYLLRVHTTRAGVTKKAVVDAMLGESQRWMYAVEKIGTDKEHLHVYFETSIKDGALRKRLKNCNVVGNGSYSLKSVKEDSPIKVFAYIMKEDEHYQCEGILLTELSEAQVYDTQKKQEKANSRLRQIDKIEEFLQPYLSDAQNLDYHQEVIIEQIVKYYVDSGKVFNKFKVRQTLDYLMCKYSESYRKTFVRDVMNL